MSKLLPEPIDFLEANKPRHEPLEALQALHASPNKTEGLQEFLGHFRATVEPPERPRTLLDMYLGGDVARIYQDALLRPEHYDSRQHQLLAALSHGTAMEQPPTDTEKNELLLTFMRTTDADKATRERNARITSQRGGGDGPIVLEDGRTLEQAASDERARATFEQQNYDDQVII